MSLDYTPPPHQPRRERERERERERRPSPRAYELPPWLVQALAAAALPLWLWVIGLSQDRARTELRLQRLEQERADIDQALKRLERIDASLNFILGQRTAPPQPRRPRRGTP